MEVCDIIPEQRYMRKLNREQTDVMMNFTRQNPSNRANKIQDGLKLLNYRENEHLQQFGMSISDEMAVVNARILPTPTIEYRQATREFRVEPKNGVWNLRDKTLAMGATLGSWSVLAFLDEDTLPKPVIEKFLVEFTNTCHNTGMNIITKKPPIMHANPQGNIEQSLKLAWINAGADVSHPAPGDKESPSYAALCDGVSEGQFNHVLKNELNAIRNACQALGANYKPTITFIVVQKRHHTRFFPMEKQNSDFKSGNCLPGTVVEEGITHPFEFDFYLLSHPGLLGTSRPTHYHVLYDKNGFDANSLQTLSYNLCYLYVRCTRAVSLVPPVYYAHLVTNRAKLHSYKESNGEITSKVVKEDLKKVMYFA
ncbi:unnamed protein product [Rhizophagus irregularis]|nr:unnamed protein product [Rhizophagus irregularis]